ncbi:hypothetical protein M408DRAFT_150331 [Serendipita vermifera MAFF 305830]|uniref:PNPLA domain-containing protein n=1 Tax=Serendipita vermifera MAFF 305830 TaxID=933852 RepID=A0A0C2XWD6_SERVB|nr:hypothetical protein M408DRAFT_150331 [Serendipita vermifera MAFF 305830]
MEELLSRDLEELGEHQSQQNLFNTAATSAILQKSVEENPPVTIRHPPQQFNIPSVLNLTTRPSDTDADTTEPTSTQSFYNYSVEIASTMMAEEAQPSRQRSGENETSRPLKLLSLDGGGVRGLSELLILQSIMDKVAWDLKLLHTPRPCEYFDLIGGTSTGGIIAVLLGRLRLSVDECLDIYSELSEQVFAEQHFEKRTSQSRYDHFILERVIKEALVRVQDENDRDVLARPGAHLSQGANEMMKDNHPEICRTRVSNPERKVEAHWGCL